VLNKSILSEQEQNEILSALQGLSSVKTAETDQVLKKLSTIFNKNTVNWLEVDFSDWSFANGKAFYDFKTAILERKIAEFDYFSTYGEMTHRRIEPIQLWFKSKAWYIKGFCLTRQDIRLFKLSRVRNLTVTGEQFAERDYLATPPNTAPASHQKPDVTLKLKIAPEMTYRVYDEFDEDNPQYDYDLFRSGADLSGHFNEAYITAKKKPVIYGNNVVLNIGVDDLAREYERVKKLGIGEISDLVYINIAAPYWCFWLTDPDGNCIEITGRYNAE